jgi:thiol-disulfide isomerase/thioredoxin
MISISNILKNALLIVLMAGSNQFAHAKNTEVVFSGVMIGEGKSSSISFYTVRNGKLEKLGFCWPDRDGNFQFRRTIEKPAIFYVAKGGGMMGLGKYSFFLQPGDSLNLHLFAAKNVIDFDSCQSNRTNAETNLLRQWNLMIAPVQKAGQISTNRNQFYSLYKQLAVQATQFKKAINTSNSDFNELMITKVDADLDFVKAGGFFFFGERLNAGYDSSEINSEFYAPLKEKIASQNGRILETENGMGLLHYYTAFRKLCLLGNQQPFSGPSIEEAVKFISNDTLKGAYVIDQMESITNMEEFEAHVAPYEKYFFMDMHKDAYQKKSKELSPFRSGKPGYDFSLADANCKNVSLSDFKGKVVVLDMWAMWCAPCLHEKPYYKKIEEEFKGDKQVVFISVSVDGTDRVKVWKEFLEHHEWSGIELISNPQESLMQYYKIKGIPRFMIFDQQGKIVTVDAPRPSNPAFKLLIEQTLQSKS